MPEELPEPLKGGEAARLFPVLAETSREGRALSVFLACLGSVDDLAGTLLATLGQRVGVRAGCGATPKSFSRTRRTA